MSLTSTRTSYDFIYLFIYSFIYLFIYLSIYLFIYYLLIFGAKTETVSVLWLTEFFLVYLESYHLVTCNCNLVFQKLKRGRERLYRTLHFLFARNLIFLWCI